MPKKKPSKKPRNSSDLSLLDGGGGSGGSQGYALIDSLSGLNDKGTTPFLGATRPDVRGAYGYGYGYGSYDYPDPYTPPGRKVPVPNRPKIDVPRKPPKRKPPKKKLKGGGGGKADTAE